MVWAGDWRLAESKMLRRLEEEAGEASWDLETLARYRGREKSFLGDVSLSRRSLICFMLLYF